jgi:hypothetical protein
MIRRIALQLLVVASIAASSEAQTTAQTFHADLTVEVARGITMRGELRIAAAGAPNNDGAMARVILPFAAGAFESSDCDHSSQLLTASATELRVRPQHGTGVLRFSVVPQLIRNGLKADPAFARPVRRAAAELEFGSLEVRIEDATNVLRFRDRAPQNILENETVLNTIRFTFLEEVRVVQVNGARRDRGNAATAGETVVVERDSRGERSLVVEYIVVTLPQVRRIALWTAAAGLYCLVLTTAFIGWPSRWAYRVGIRALLFAGLCLFVGVDYADQSELLLRGGTAVVGAAVLLYVDFFLPRSRGQQEQTHSDYEFRQSVFRRAQRFEYESIELFLSAGGGQLTVEVPGTSAGKLLARGPLPKISLSSIGSPTTQSARALIPLTRRAPNPETNRMGDDIGRALIPEQNIRPYFAGLYDRLDETKGLRICLRLNDEAVVPVPWELARYGDEFLSRRPATPVARLVTAKVYGRKRPFKPPLRILGVLSTPSDLGRIDAAQERRRLDEALKRAQKRGDVKLDWLPSATVAELQDFLREGYHAVHFIGHGAAESQGSHGVLFFTDDAGRSAPLPCDGLATLLRDSGVRFVFLNACESGSSLGNVAKTLVERGVSAAIGMQTPVADRVAIALASQFYSALADGWPIDAALVEGRKAIVGVTPEGAPDWVHPVLYLNSISDGDLLLGGG